MNASLDYSEIYIDELFYDDEYKTIIKLLGKNTHTLSNLERLIFEQAVYEQIDRALAHKKYRFISFGESSEWLNTERPLTLDDFQNKLYIVDFFTYCCINCLHVLPYLKEVEEKYQSIPGFAVLGIHSPKFPNERDLDQVKHAVQRYEIKHPVLSDAQSEMWNLYKVNCWPTVFIVGPGHILLFVLVGESQIEKLPIITDFVMKYYKSHEVDLVNNHEFLPIRVPDGQVDFSRSEKDFKRQTKKCPEKLKLHDVMMLQPGNVSTSNFLIAASDTGHHTVLIFSSAFELEYQVGHGVKGAEDGCHNMATFNWPHGTAWYNGDLYVADTGNHSIRKVDFSTLQVTTVYKNQPDSSKEGRSQFLSPWDLCVGPDLGDPSNDDVLYIAVAGSHQIWAYNFVTKSAKPIAGSGKEENRPNLYPMKAGFAQPSGITYSSCLPDYLFIADSESSTIKSLDIRSGAVANIVGGGLDPSDLFQFGDEDGIHRKVKLQHPMGICVVNNQTLAVADTYNHKIKMVNVRERSCITVPILTKEINEPSGIELYNKTLLVANTNYNDITEIPVPENYVSDAEDTLDSVHEKETSLITLNDTDANPQNFLGHVHYAGEIHVGLFWDDNSGLDINKNSVQEWSVSINGGKFEILYKSPKVFDEKPFLIVKPKFVSNGPAHEKSDFEIKISRVPVCDNRKGICSFKDLTFEFQVEVSTQGVKIQRYNLHCVSG